MKLLTGTVLVVSLLLIGCGMSTTNAFQGIEKDDAAQDAAHELENDRPEKAIKILEKALNSDPENFELISLLSAAYAQKYGISLIDIALDMAAPSEGGSSNEPLTKLWPGLPEATDEVVAGVAYAVELLLMIPLDERKDSDSFKLGLLSTISASLQLKALDLDGDGSLSQQELFGLNSSNASVVLSALAAASQATAAIGGDSNSGKASAKIGSIYTAINASEGETDEEKLAAYLARR